MVEGEPVAGAPTLARLDGGRLGPRAERRHQRAGLGRRLELQVLRQPPGELVVRPERRGALAGAVEQAEVAAERGLVVGGEVERAPGLLRGVGQAALALRLGQERPRAAAAARSRSRSRSRSSQSWNSGAAPAT